MLIGLLMLVSAFASLLGRVLRSFHIVILVVGVAWFKNRLQALWMRVGEYEYTLLGLVIETDLSLYG